MELCGFRWNFPILYPRSVDSWGAKRVTIDHPIAAVDSGVHYIDVIMGAMASQITSLTIVYSFTQAQIK